MASLRSLSGPGCCCSSTDSVALSASASAAARPLSSPLSVGLPEQLRRLHIVHDFHARYAARIRAELSARELRMQPLDMWAVLKRLEPTRRDKANPHHLALSESQRACKPIVAPGSRCCYYYWLRHAALLDPAGTVTPSCQGRWCCTLEHVSDEP